MARALVLNATYEPLSVVTQRRAAVLVLYERADVVHGSGRMIRSARHELELPSVVRLRTYVRAPQRRSCAITRRGVFARDGHKCQYCGGRAENIDHVTPRSRGGPHTWENVVAACKACNTRKRDRLPAEIRMLPLSKPKAPGRFAWVRQAVPQVPDAWLAYIEPGRTAAAS
ncbi:MAG: HNH endonuclease [Actinomycetota bacterium]